MNNDNDTTEGEIWNAHKEEGRRKRWANRDHSIKILLERGIHFRQFSESHYRIGAYDFWPTTGKFIHTETKKAGRGIFNLLKLL